MEGLFLKMRARNGDEIWRALCLFCLFSRKQLLDKFAGLFKRHARFAYMIALRIVRSEGWTEGTDWKKEARFR
jgi:hypothetical protein